MLEKLGPIYKLYLKIKEPRRQRVLQFGVYLCMIFSGAHIIRETPTALIKVLENDFLVNWMGAFIALGALLGAFAVLPGIWWLERTGIHLLGSGLTMYLVVVIYLHASWLGVAVSGAFILTFVIRYFEIKDSMLAPREE